MVDDEELLELVEMEVRDLLLCDSGDNTQSSQVQR